MALDEVVGSLPEPEKRKPGLTYLVACAGSPERGPHKYFGKYEDKQQVYCKECRPYAPKPRGAA